MAHHRSSSHKQEKDFRGLYIGAALGVAATQLCNYCLDFPQPKPPLLLQSPPDQVVDPAKLKVLRDRECSQIFLFHKNLSGPYVSPDLKKKDMLSTMGQRSAEFFDSNGGYIGWVFPVPWENENINAGLVHPPTLTPPIANYISNNRKLIDDIRIFIDWAIDYVGLVPVLSTMNRADLVRELDKKWWILNIDEGLVTWDHNISAMILQMFEFIACLGKRKEGIYILISILSLIDAQKLKVQNQEHVGLWYVALKKEDPWVKPDKHESTLQFKLLRCQSEALEMKIEDFPKHSILVVDED